MNSRKIIAALGIALALSFAPLPAHAEGKIAIGPQGGWTFPNFNVKNASINSLTSSNNGWMAGLFAEFGLWAITLRPELNYVTKGYTVANVANVKNNYLEVPVLVKINPLGGLPFSPFIVVGPQWTKQVSASVSAVGGGPTTYNNTVTDWDISGVAGLGVDINFSENVALDLQGRYIYGFRNVDTSGSATIYERGFYVLGGISFQNAF